ncbi:MAG TPA: hypothetical protein VJ824_09365 [Bacillota bacterium]|nr:hypothetical protein [Bacillota bacterium]
MFWLVWAVVGVLTWWGMGAWMKGNEGVGGYWAALIANLFGAWFGEWLLGDWGIVFYNFNVVAGLLGAFVISYLWNILKSQL